MLIINIMLCCVICMHACMGVCVHKGNISIYEVDACLDYNILSTLHVYNLKFDNYNYYFIFVCVSCHVMHLCVCVQGNACLCIVHTCNSYVSDGKRGAQDAWSSAPQLLTDNYFVGS